MVLVGGGGWWCTFSVAKALPMSTATMTVCERGAS